MAEPLDPTLPHRATTHHDNNALLPERYDDHGRIGTGAMGEVRRVFDRHLQADRAMKLLRFEVFDDPVAVQRFEEEARLQARLSHPAIVSVHDLGVLPNGRRWFTMDLVQGRTLAEVFAADSAGQHRLVDVVRQVALAVAYAHSQGVVHRDLKPSNIMIGPFQEVVVMDWGISRARPAPSVEAPVTAGTRHGSVLGTPAYMPPEQARGAIDEVGAHSDVYALGAVLYEVLTGRAPFTGADALTQLLVGPPQPVRRAAAGEVPEELADLVEVAMGRDTPTLRPTSLAFAAALERWLDGARRRERALTLVADARAASPRAAELRADADALSQQASAQLQHVAPHDPIDAKRPAWRQLERAAELHRDARRSELDAMELARAALELAPGLPEARAVLADHFRARMHRAEAAGDAEGAGEAETLLRRYDDGTHAAWLVGEGEVHLTTLPSGARVVAHRLRPRDRRLEPAESRELGTTPLVGARLPHGAWILEMSARGHHPARYPVLLARAGRWDATPPDSDQPMPIALLPDGQLGPDEVYIPASWFVSGGDGRAIDGLPRRRLWVDGMVMQRHPVTNADYLAFLDELVRTGRAEEARQHVPTEVHTASGERVAVWPVGEDGRHVLSSSTDAQSVGRAWQPNDPVTLVDQGGAEAYAAWLEEQTGRPWRLPHDQEWEKAARGVDGRHYPWGDHLDPTWARMAHSDGDGASAVPIDRYPDDISPYGVRGMAGNSRDRCANGYRRLGMEPGEHRVPPVDAQDSPWRMVRGGSWYAAADHCRAAGRSVARPEERRLGLGFRLCYASASTSTAE